LGTTLCLACVACAERDSAEVVLDFWAMGREGEVVARMMPEFERRHPGVRVRVQQIPWSAAHEKLLTAYVGGVMPDLFQAGNTWLPELAALGAVEPLDGYLDSSTVRRQDYFAGVWAANVMDGATLGVPWYVDTRLLFYRADLLRGAGFEEPPRSWSLWLQAMQAIKARAEDGYAILVPLREWQLPVILALQQGAELLRDGDRYGDFESAEFRTAFELYLRLFRTGLAPAAGDTQVANLYQDFAAGFFAFYVTGPWNLGEMARRLPQALQDHWRTAPMPAPGTGYPGVSLALGSSIALFSGSTHKDAAWKLVEYLSQPALQLELYELTGDLPSRQSVWEHDSLAGNSRTAAFRIQLQALRSAPKIPEWERIAEKIAQHSEAAVRGSLPADEALAGLNADVDRILEKRRWLLSRQSDASR
jgi:multiple sugar transport system substrate-binding protein